MLRVSPNPSVLATTCDIAWCLSVDLLSTLGSVDESQPLLPFIVEELGTFLPAGTVCLERVETGGETGLHEQHVGCCTPKEASFSSQNVDSPAFSKKAVAPLSSVPSGCPLGVISLAEWEVNLYAHHYHSYTVITIIYLKGQVIDNLPVYIPLLN